jgi:hypothetical protein
MNPAALGRLRAVMASLRTAGKAIRGQNFQRVRKSFSRVSGASGEAARVGALKAAEKSGRIADAKHALTSSFKARPNTKAENVMKKLTAARKRMAKIKSKIAPVAVGGLAVGTISNMRKHRKQEEEPYVRRAY